MHEIQLDDQLFQEAQRRAAEAGFGSVDEYVADRLRHDFDQTADLDHFFTSERLAHIEQAAAQVDAGLGIPSEEVRQHFRRKRDA